MDITLRWVVRVDYFGLFDSDFCICATDTLVDAAEIIDGLVVTHYGRPIRYYAKKVTDDYIPEFDDPHYCNPISGIERDLSVYLDGLSCLGSQKGGD